MNWGCPMAQFMLSNHVNNSKEFMMATHRLFFVFFGIISAFNFAIAQEINQMDENGERHGIWQKKFPGTDQLRYEGEFDHGKEIGTFKFYCEDCGSQPMVIKVFNRKDDIADVKYFTKKGKLVSEGAMQSKKKGRTLEILPREDQYYNDSRKLYQWSP